MDSIAKLGMAVALAAVVCLPAMVRADEAQTIKTAVDQSFQPLLGKYDVPGIAVAVTIDGRQHFFNYGVASKEKQTPVTKDTLFELGSVSKTFTATLFGLAQTRGKIALDDHPGKFIPQLRGSAIDKATLLNLGTYTAGGLPLQLPGKVNNTADVTAYFRQWKPSFAPGTQRRYSNPSIGLFGYVTSLALGGDFGKLIETEIFPKVGLRESYIRVPAAAMARYAWGYNSANKPVRANPAVFAEEAYGVKASTADMIRYVEVNIHPDTLDTPMRRRHRRHACRLLQHQRNGAGTWLGAIPISGDAGAPAGRQRRRDGDEGESGDAGRIAAASVDANLVQQDRIDQRLRRLRRLRSGKRIGIVMLANKSLPTPARVAAAHAVLTQLDALSGKPKR